MHVTACIWQLGKVSLIVASMAMFPKCVARRFAVSILLASCFPSNQRCCCGMLPLGHPAAHAEPQLLAASTCTVVCLRCHCYLSKFACCFDLFMVRSSYNAALPSVELAVLGCPRCSRVPNCMVAITPHAPAACCLLLTFNVTVFSCLPPCATFLAVWVTGWLAGGIS